MDGLLDSMVAVPLISCAVLRGFAKLQTKSQDNVLVEHCFALELKQRGELRGLVPVLIGEHDRSGVYHNFFAARALADADCVPPDFALPSVNRLLKKHMHRKKKGVPLSKAGTKATVKEVLGEMLEYQGAVLGAEDVAELSRAAKVIAAAVSKAKEVRTPTSSPRGSEWGTARPSRFSAASPRMSRMSSRTFGWRSRSSRQHSDQTLRSDETIRKSSSDSGALLRDVSCASGEGTRETSPSANSRGSTVRRIFSHGRVRVDSGSSAGQLRVDGGSPGRSSCRARAAEVRVMTLRSPLGCELQSRMM